MFVIFLLELSMKKALASFIHNLHRIKTIPDQKGNYGFLEMQSHKTYT